MSAIEVLKCMIEDRKCFCGCSLENSADTEINALDDAIVALEQKENKNKIIHKIDEIVSKDIWDFGQRIEEIEDEVDRQSNGRKPQMTNEQIDEIDKLKGRVLEARKIKNYLEEVRTKSKEVLELIK